MKYYINRIYLKNFKCIKSENGILIDFNLNKGLIGLSGPNGFGKTTIFDAIEITFSDKIERVVPINKGNRKVKDNLLIYKNRDSAIIAIELVNEEKNNVVTIIKRIKKNGKNKEEDIKESIESFHINEYIDLDKINNSDYGNKIENLKGFLQNTLGMNNEYYNYFYYISQDNSSNFLKKGLKERKSIFDILMKIEKEIDLNKKIKDLVDGKKINSISNLIDLKKQEIKNDIKSLFNIESNDLEYQSNIKIFEQSNMIEWDKDEYTIKNKKALNEVDKLIEFLGNYKVFVARKNNRQIEALLNDELLSEFVNFVVLSDYKCSLEYEKNIKNKIDEFNANKDIYNALKRINEFSFTDNKIINDLKYINDNLKLDLNVTKISNSITDIIKYNQQLNIKKRNIKQLQDSIEKLNKLFIENIDKDEQNVCPICKSKFISAEKLQTIIKNNIDELQELISSDNREEEKKIKEELKKIVDECKEKLNIIDLDQYNTNIECNLILLRKYYTKEILKNYIEYYTEIGKLNEIIDMIKDNTDTARNNLKELLQLRLIKEEKDYSEINYSKDYQTYRWYVSKLNNKSIFDDNLDELLDRAKKKKKYFERELSLLDTNEKNIINDKIKELIKMEELENHLDNLNEIYKNTIKNFKEDVVSRIEIPLYIYTGKIIQTYQGGLGVFIKEDNNTDNILFTPNSNDSEHDIVNTFSSGQLSAFTIAFLLVINQLYLTGNKSGNTLNTILIDDPVQTMDDVNIASLIEVLRNQFSEYQMILSTHEDEKINYIRYKFEKFGIKTSEYNVKKNFFET